MNIETLNALLEMAGRAATLAEKLWLAGLAAQANAQIEAQKAQTPPAPDAA